MRVQLLSPLVTSQLPIYQHVYLSRHHQLAPVLVRPLPRVQSEHVLCRAPRIAYKEGLVADVEELLEIVMALHFDLWMELLLVV